MRFTVEASPGTRIQVVTDQTEIRGGDCINVEQAGKRYGECSVSLQCAV